MQGHMESPGEGIPSNHSEDIIIYLHPICKGTALRKEQAGNSASYQDEP